MCGEANVAVTVLLAALSASSVALASTLPKFPPRTPYAEARRSLLALGYSPIALPDADDTSRARCGFKPGSVAGAGGSGSAIGGDLRCFPEMEACAGSGLGQCVFAWRRAETIIEVVTVGELPVVGGVRCRVNC
jgi:hypothetical protein